MQSCETYFEFIKKIFCLISGKHRAGLIDERMNMAFAFNGDGELAGRIK